MHLVSRVNELSKAIHYIRNSEVNVEKGPNKLFSELVKIPKFIAQKLNSKNQIPMNLTGQEKEEDFQNAEDCQISVKDFNYSDSDNFEEILEAEYIKCTDPDDMLMKMRQYIIQMNQMIKWINISK